MAPHVMVQTMFLRIGPAVSVPMDETKTFASGLKVE